MSKKLLCSLLLIIILNYPISIQSSDINVNCANNNNISIKEIDNNYCQNLIDGYTFILWSWEKQYSNKVVDENAIKYMNNINEKILYYKNQCGIKNNNYLIPTTLLSKKM